LADSPDLVADLAPGRAGVAHEQAEDPLVDGSRRRLLILVAHAGIVAERVWWHGA
jgi:hypothetical protein